MAGDSVKRDKVASYLAGLSPAARDMLLRKVEREGGAADPDLRAALDAARAGAATPPAVRAPAAPAASFDVRARFFAPFAPFVIDERLTERQRGWIARDTLDGLWTFLARDVLAEALVPWSKTALAGARVTDAEFDAAVRTMRGAAFSDFARRLRESDGDPKQRQRLAMQLGGDGALADVIDLSDLRERLPALERLFARLPLSIGATELAERLVAEQVLPHLESHADDDYVAAGIALRAASPITLFRLAVLIAGSDDVLDIRDTPGAAFVDAGLATGARAVARFALARRDRSDTGVLVAEIRRFHEVVRGATTVVLVHNDARWRSRLIDLRKAMSHAVTEVVEDALPVLRRALRLEPGARPSAADGEDAVRAVTVFACARRHREALALNELISRMSAPLDQAIDVYGRELIEGLRKARGEARADLTAVSEQLLRMAEMAHGEEYAALLRKSRDIALGRTAGG